MTEAGRERAFEEWFFKTFGRTHWQPELESYMRQAYQAGRESMREEAAKTAEAQMGECTSRPNCHMLDATLIRALPAGPRKEGE